jgi:uncharacterized protein (TIGR00156 family)
LYSTGKQGKTAVRQRGSIPVPLQKLLQEGFMKTLKFSFRLRYLVLAGVLLAVSVPLVFGHEEREDKKRDPKWHEASEMWLNVPLTVSAGGFVEPLISVSDAQTLKDDMPVRMQGTIVRSLGNKRYEFRDNSGTITVFIDRKLWMGISVTDQDTVEISGLIDKLFSTRRVKVRAIQKLPVETPAVSDVS